MLVCTLIECVFSKVLRKPRTPAKWWSVGHMSTMKPRTEAKIVRNHLLAKMGIYSQYLGLSQISRQLRHYARTFDWVWICRVAQQNQKIWKCWLNKPQTAHLAHTATFSGLFNKRVVCLLKSVFLSDSYGRVLFLVKLFLLFWLNCFPFVFWVILSFLSKWSFSCYGVIARRSFAHAHVPVERCLRVCLWYPAWDLTIPSIILQFHLADVQRIQEIRV